MLAFRLSIVHTGMKIPMSTVGVSYSVPVPTQQVFYYFTFQFNVNSQFLFLYFSFDTTADWSIFLPDVLESLSDMSMAALSSVLIWGLFLIPILTPQS